MKFKISPWPGYFLVFVFAFFFALSLRQLTDYDVWFQLLAGQETVRTLAVPRHEFYIYSALGEPSLFVGWLWGTCLYLAWLAGGYSAVSVFGAMVWGAVFVIGAKATLALIERELPYGEKYSRKAAMAAILVGASVAFQALSARAGLRAEVSMYLAWVIAVYFSAGIAEDRQRFRRFLFVVPLLSWALGWFHTTSIFMLLFLVVHMLQAGADAVRQPLAGGLRKFVRKDIGAWSLAIFASAALPCLNPNGVEQALPLINGLLATLQHMLPVGRGAIEEPVAQVILEYRRLAEVPSAWFTAIVFFIFSLIVVWEDRSRRVVNSMLLAVGLSLSMLHVRSLAIWGVFLMVPLGAAIAPSLQKAASVLESKRRRVLVGALIGMCCFWNAADTYYAQRGQWGMGYAPSTTDEQLLRSIREYLPDGGNIFNWHPLGAYLRWHLGPEFLVAMDGHFVNSGSLAAKAYDDIEGWSNSRPPLMEKWKIQAVYHPVVTPVFGSVPWLPYYLVNDPNWRLVAMDRAGALFARVPIGSVDEHARNRQKLDYWNRVVIEATNVEVSFVPDDNKKRAKRVVDYAQARIEELEKLSIPEDAHEPH